MRVLGPKLLNARAMFGPSLAFRPGHFHSPICDPAELSGRYRDPLTTTPPAHIPAIDLGHERQRFCGKVGNTSLRRPVLSQLTTVPGVAGCLRLHLVLAIRLFTHACCAICGQVVS